MEPQAVGACNRLFFFHKATAAGCLPRVAQPRRYSGAFGPRARYIGIRLFQNRGNLRRRRTLDTGRIVGSNTEVVGPGREILH